LPFDPSPPESAGGPDRGAIATALRCFRGRHPYLLFDRGAIDGLRRRASASPQLAEKLARTLKHRETATDPRTRLKRCGRRLLLLAFAGLVCDGRGRRIAVAAARAMLEELAATASWDGRSILNSFLDRAEIAIAVALAYDWLYEELSGPQRRAIEAALRRQIVVPALTAYADPGAVWARRRSNSAMASHAVGVICALALATLEPADAANLLPQGIAAAAHALSALAPDGAWPEGLSYWSLTMRHAALLIAALEATLGQSFGLASLPGLSETGDFALHAVGPFGAAFDFGDSAQAFDPLPMAWLAQRYGRLQDGWPVHAYDGSLLPLSLIWGERRAAEPAARGLSTGKVFRGCDVACFRSTWSTAPGARPVFLAIKGGTGHDGAGDPGASENLNLHAQADAGSFVLDGARRRWVTDLGADDYDLPGYFEHGTRAQPGRRWRYYRNQTAGHNTLILNGRSQIMPAAAPIVGAGIDGGRQWVVFDLSAAYGRPTHTIRRGAALLGRKVVIQDEIASVIEDDIVWAMHTSAEPQFVGLRTARFRDGGDWFAVIILAPQSARLQLTAPPPPATYAVEPGAPGDQAQIAELPRQDDRGEDRAAGAPLRRLEIAWPKGSRRLAVMLLPDSIGEDEAALPVIPLDQWLDYGPRP
jgi:hypothetical protein